MKKVGLVTYCEGNFGSVLQCYATQSLLREKGVACELLQRKETTFLGRLHMRAGFRLNRTFKYMRYPKHRTTFDELVLMLASGSGRRMNDASAQKTARFIREHIVVRDVSYKQIKRAARTKAYTAFFSGSDQIWSASWFVRNPWWFLRFAPKQKRVAWAPSFGGDAVAPYNVVDYARYIKSYAHLSAREDLGVDIIKQLTGRDAAALSDPSVLLDREQWRELYRDRDRESEPYVLLFFLDPPSSVARDMIAHVQELTGKRLLVFAYDEHESLGDVPARNGDPADFLAMIDGAEFVLTDSFHAAMFSTIFGTPFFIFNRNSKASTQSIRMRNHVKTYGLESRYLTEVRPMTEADLHMDQAHIDAVLSQKRERFEAYLDEVLQDYED